MENLKINPFNSLEMPYFSKTVTVVSVRMHTVHVLYHLNFIDFKIAK